MKRVAVRAETPSGYKLVNEDAYDPKVHELVCKDTGQSLSHALAEGVKEGDKVKEDKGKKKMSVAEARKKHMNSLRALGRPHGINDTDKEELIQELLNAGLLEE